MNGYIFKGSKVSIFIVVPCQKGSTPKETNSLFTAHLILDGVSIQEGQKEVIK